MKEAGYKINMDKTQIKYVKSFPDTEKKFNSVFLNEDGKKNNDLYFKKKIIYK